MKTAVILTCITSLSVIACISMNRNRDLPVYLKNINLPVILKGFPGNMFSNGIFIDPDHSMDLSFFRVLRWKFSANPMSEDKKNDPFKLRVIPSTDIFDVKKDVAVWLGHASFFIRIDGKNFLIDPVLGDIPFNKRLCEQAVRISDIRNVDYVLVSHAHLDHLDSTTIKKSNLKNARAFIPLGMSDTIKEFNDGIKCEEAGWFQRYSTDGPEVYFLPSRHWSRRSLMDFNKILWGSFIIKCRKKTIYFAADSAYGTHFAQIAKLFPVIDIALMPVGAYRPAYIMKNNHMTPQEAVQASNDLGAKLFIPMHYGTFDLSDEPAGEPLRLLNWINENKMLKAKLKVLNPGEIMYL